MSGCDVCGNEPMKGVASIPGIPVSVAYGENCLRANAHPWWALVGNTAMLGGLDQAADWWQNMVRDTCRHLGKSLADFNREVAEEIADAAKESPEDRDPQRQELLYTGTNWRQVEEFTGCRVQRVSRALALRNGWPWSEQSIEILTPRGFGRLEPGDWIRRGDDGEFYKHEVPEQVDAFSVCTCNAEDETKCSRCGQCSRCYGLCDCEIHPGTRCADCEADEDHCSCEDGFNPTSLTAD